MFDKTVLVLFTVFVLLNGLDVITTIVGLKLGAKEANPTTAKAIDTFGLTQALLLKFLLVLFLGLVSLLALWYAEGHEPESLHTTRLVVIGTLAVGCIAYIPIVLNNLRVLILQW